MNIQKKDDNEKIKFQEQNKENRNDCGCEGDCCPPKKHNIVRTIFFAVIILAAMGIVAFKLTHKPAAEPGKESCCPPGSSATCDTTKTSSSDTSGNSSCCPKK